MNPARIETGFSVCRIGQVANKGNDYVVVDLGWSGCVLSSRLIDDAASEFVVEDGEQNDHSLIHLPARISATTSPLT